MLTSAQTDGERLLSHVWPARELGVTHQLADANGRTSNSTLIKWIIEDKSLPKYIPEDPNILDLLGPEAIFRHVHSGMRRFKVLSHEDPNDLIDVETLIDQAQIRNKSWDVVHRRAELPKEVIAKLVAEDRKAKGQ